MRVPRPAARTTAAVRPDGSVREVTRAFSGGRSRPSNDSDAASGSWADRDSLDLDPGVLGKPSDGKCRARRWGVREEPRIGRVDVREVPDVGEEHGRLDDVREAAAAGVENGLEVLDRPLQLRLDAALDELAAPGIEPDLPGAEHEVVCRDGLAVRPDRG